MHVALFEVHSGYSVCWSAQVLLVVCWYAEQGCGTNHDQVVDYVAESIGIIIIINPCQPYLSASATAPHPLGKALVCEVERSLMAAKETALSSCVVLLSSQCGMSGGNCLGRIVM
jgi:hypothetical protein